MGADAAAEEQFGPYLVYERLGVGGMATVHRALERGIEGFERIVALKRLLPHLAADASFIKAFVREAKLASLLNHVNIVQIFELGRVGTQYFISMEYIDGRDIRRILRHARKVSGPPPIHVTVGLLLQLCDALDYAHHKVDDTGQPLGLVHRDVSPSNVLVTINGHVKVIDFGIAKAQSAQLRTQTGRVKGKLGYMAPEALAGKDLDARSDLFAAGVIAHELLTARPLFATKNEYETLMKIQRGDVMPPSTFNQSCPAELDAIVLRALARDPDERFLHASELRDELHAMRKQYSMQASDREVASWLEWAFGPAAPVDAPGGAGFEHSDVAIDVRARRAGRPEAHGVAPPAAEPGPRSSRGRGMGMEEDELIDLAWGTSDDGNGEPIVLDDVPDVTDKHFTSSLGADVRLDLDDLDDDIPTPSPSHGSKPPPATGPRARPASSPQALSIKPVASASSRTVTASLRPRTSTAAPSGAIRATAGAIRAPASAPAPRKRAGSTGPTSPGRPAFTDGAADQPDGVRTPNVGVGVGVRSTMIPPRVRTITIPPRLVTAGATAPRPVTSLPPPPPRAASDGSPTPPRGVPSGSTPPRSDVPGLGTNPGSRDHSLAGAGELASRYDQRATERTPMFSPDDLGGDTMPSLPMMRPQDSLPLLRPQDSLPVLRPQDSLPVLRSQDSLPSLRDSDAMTVLRVADPLPEEAFPPPTARQSGPRPKRSRLITPATALFAEPDPDGEAASGASRDLTASINNLTAIPLPAPSPPRRRTGRRVGIALAVIVLSGAIAAAIALVIGGQLTASRDDRAPRPAPVGVGTATLAVAPVPADASITIDGKPPRLAASGKLELAPGVHQIEVRREGYKSWLTSIDLAAGEARALPVTLERLGDAVITNRAPPAPAGSLVVASTEVSQLSGELPALHGSALPPEISARLCIDEAGHVTSYETITAVDDRTAAEISTALRAWRYAPYKVAGSARTVCFEVALPVR